MLQRRRTCILTRACSVLYLQDPRSVGELAPVVRGHEGPVVEALARGVPHPLLQQAGPRAPGRRQEDLDLPPPARRHGDARLHVLQVLDPVPTPHTPVCVQGHSDLPVHRDSPANRKWTNQQGERKRNGFINDALNTFYLRLYRERKRVKCFI